MALTPRFTSTRRERAQVYVDEAGEILAGSRSRWLTPGKSTDNFGFAQWVADNKNELLKLGL